VTQSIFTANKDKQEKAHLTACRQVSFLIFKKHGGVTLLLPIIMIVLCLVGGGVAYFFIIALAEVPTEE